MHDYWTIIEKRTGRKICECSNENDALLLISFDIENRTYRKNKFILDQIIDVNSKVTNQLPGQLGLPSAVDSLMSSDEQYFLPDTQEAPIHI